MLKKTNLDACKELAIAFLHMPIEKTIWSPVVVTHPIFESGFYNYKDGNSFKICDILEDERARNQAITNTEKAILQASDAYSVYFIIRNSYRLAFLKHAKNYLSLADFSKLFADAWVISENPNQDPNVSIKTLVSWFKQADKRVLMSDEDYQVYDSLPERITVYRGVGFGRNPKGLSWTANRSTAEWFAHRFDTEDNKGYIQKATIDKSTVLAYFNRRGEDEIVVDSKGLKIRIE